ncbi:MAG: sterol desaturase family protein, partial [bacterium]
MNKFIVIHEGSIRFLFFIGMLVLMATWEKLSPRRSLSTSKSLRWFSNLGLVLISTLSLRWLLPIQAVGVASFAETRGWGLLNNISLPYWLAIVIGIAALDFVIYLQHAMFHFIPLFWRLHRVHHTDLDFDATTGVRFHPIEILLSMGIKMVTVVVLGPSPLTVILFELLLSTTSLFNHGNVQLPGPIDRWLRLLVVTPEMHRVHHSVLIKEYNSNFGFNLPWWDRLLGTYRAQPEAGHIGMIIGNSSFRDPRRLTLGRLLVQP